MTAQTTAAAAPAGNVTHIKAPTPYPEFEGAVVAGTVIIIKGMSNLSAGDGVVVTTDDIVRMAMELRCVSVEHKVDPKSGELMRYQTLSPKSADVIPFDPGDPKDDGIVRSRAIPGWTP